MPIASRLAGQVRLVGMSGLIFCMVMMEMWVVAKTSALTLSVAGTLKEVGAAGPSPSPKPSPSLNPSPEPRTNADQVGAAGPSRSPGPGPRPHRSSSPRPPPSPSPSPTQVITIACAEEVFHEHLSYVNMLGLLLCNRLVAKGWGSS